MEWRRIIGNDPENDGKLAYEVWHKEELVYMIRSKRTGIYITWFKSEKDIDIPFDWFFNTIQEAKNRIV